jgi:hypothetical protein
MPSRAFRYLIMRYIEFHDFKLLEVTHAAKVFTEDVYHVTSVIKD